MLAKTIYKELIGAMGLLKKKARSWRASSGPLVAASLTGNAYQ
jgi:hypothetical protein